MVGLKFSLGLALILLSLLCAQSKYVPYQQTIPLNSPYNDTINPCTWNYYNVPKIGGNQNTFLIANYSELSNTGQTVGFSLYYSSFTNTPAAYSYSCKGSCSLQLFCGFMPGSWWLGVNSPSSPDTDVMNFTVQLSAYTVPVTAENSFPFSTNVLNSQQNTSGFEPQKYDHYSIPVGTQSMGSDMILKVKNIASSSSTELQMCLNFGTLSNGKSGPCCQQWNQSSGQNDFQIKVSSCGLQSGTYFASVQVPANAKTNYTFSGSIVSQSITPIQPGAKVSGLLGKGEIDHYRLTYTPNVQMPNLLITLSGVVGGTATVYIHNGTGLAGPHACDAMNYKQCFSDDICSFTVPPCILQTSSVWYIAVAQDSFTSGMSSVLYGLEADLVSGAPTTVTLTNGMFFNASSIGEDQYNHYELVLGKKDLQADSILSVQLYVNSDQNPVMLFMNSGSEAGNGDCYSNTGACTTQNNTMNGKSSCHFTLQRCNLTAGSYFFSVYGIPNSFYGTPVSYTIKFVLSNAQHSTTLHPLLKLFMVVNMPTTN